jgi:hypothetical protein
MYVDFSFFLARLWGSLKSSGGRNRVMCQQEWSGVSYSYYPTGMEKGLIFWLLVRSLWCHFVPPLFKEMLVWGFYSQTPAIPVRWTTFSWAPHTVGSDDNWSSFSFGEGICFPLAEMLESYEIVNLSNFSWCVASIKTEHFLWISSLPLDVLFCKIGMTQTVLTPSPSL